MDFRHLTSRKLAAFAILRRKQEKLSAALADVEAKLETFGSRRGRRPLARKKGKLGRRKPGTLGAGILALLKAADSKGIHVDVIAKKLKRKKQAIYAWFYTTGKRKAKKVAPATYAAA